MNCIRIDRGLLKLLFLCLLSMTSLSWGQIIPPAGVQLQWIPAENPASTGQPTLLTLRVSNHLPEPIPQGEVRVITPPESAGVFIISAKSPYGDGLVETNVVRFRLLNLAPQQSVNLDVNVLVQEEGTFTFLSRTLIPQLQPVEELLQLPFVINKDYGDAPDPSYPTLLVNDGARHRILQGWHLGQNIDSEPDGQPSLSATRDDVNGAVDDEDGVMFPAFFTSGGVGNVRIASSTNGLIDAWIDFDQNGAWDITDKIIDSLPVVPGNGNVFTFPIPAGLASGVTYARFRLSNAGGLLPTGYAPEGEVEDYRVRIYQGVDMDVNVNNPDPVDPGQPVNLQAVVANRGDIPATDVLLTATLPMGASVESINANQGSCTTQDNLITCQLGTVEPDGIVSLDLQVTIAHDGSPLVSGTVSSLEADINPLNNEFQWEIPFLFNQDFGDAPDPSYPTLLIHNGARHTRSPLYMGAHRDMEPDGIPHWAARGDDLTGTTDDEDGIRFMSPLMVGRTAKLQVVATGDGRLDAWIDFRANGNWTDPGEQIFLSTPVFTGTNNLTFTVPAWAVPGRSYARFRLSVAGGLAPDGPAPDGEVEDYRLRIRPFNPDVWLSHAREQGRLKLQWTEPGSVLQQATSPKGPWTPVNDAASPFIAPQDGPRKFYRLWMRKPHIDLADMVRESDLVFDGTVTEVQYRNSDMDENHDFSVPMTFVTFQVNEVLKGKIEGNQHTMRFIGGRAPDGAIMSVSESTLFDVGEQSVVFAQGNNQRAVPLVDGSHGRFRIVEEQVYTEGGQEILWSEEATLEFGQHAQLLEVQENNLGDQLMQRIRQNPEPNIPDSTQGVDNLSFTEVSGLNMEVNLFKSVVKDFVDYAHSPADLQGLKTAPSANYNEQFFVPRPTDALLTDLHILVPSDPEEEEEELYEANGENPVLD